MTTDDDDVPPSERIAPQASVGRERLIWLLLAFAPSSLLLGVTEFVTTDLASVPLLWVVPLALYLASFIVAFAKKQVVTPATASRVLALLAAVVGISKVAGRHEPAVLIVGLHLALLFVASVVCHRALALRRPHHTRLTEFYLLLSVGGVLGGAFNGLVAPVVFDDLLEYPIAIALVLLARIAIDRADDPLVTWRRDVLYGLGLTVVTFGLVRIGSTSGMPARISVLWMYVLPVLAAFAWSRKPIRYAVALGGILLVSTMSGGLTGNTVHEERDFFGSLKVRLDPTGKFLLLVSGSTVHGAQAVDPAKKRVPLTYYSPTGPAGDVLGPIASTPADIVIPPRRVGVIGLGVGSLAAYARSGESWTFFELNPRVVDIAKTYFSYLAGVAPGTNVTIEVGDARLRLREGGAARFDLLVLDAFSSDAIPVHLMTREALAIYKRTMTPGGVLLAHISNRHVRLEPVLAALASDAQMLAIARNETDTPRDVERANSHWVCLSDSQDALDAIVAKSPQWRRLPPPANQKVWTDDFANVLAAMHF